MIIPNPARVVTIQRAYDDVSGLIDETTQESYAFDVADTGNGLIRWSGRLTQLYNLVDQGDRVVGSNQKVDPDPTSGDVAPAWTYTFHEVTTYDAVRRAPMAGVPQPLIVVRADIQEGGSMLAQQLDAVVAADNTVVTLMLDTGLGVFLRYGHDWQLLEPDSQTLEDLAIVQVGPGALDSYDAAQAAGVTLSVFELPTVTQDDDRDIVDPEDLPSYAERQAVTASIPVVASVADLDLGVRFAQAHPAARWYVTKRAHALSAGHLLPPEWANQQIAAVTAGGIRLDNVQAVLTAAEMYRNLRPEADPDDDFYRAVVASARKYDLLQSPDVVRAIRAHAARRRPTLVAVGDGPADDDDHDAALVAGPLNALRRARGGFQEWQHPRGADGKFVNKGGSVNVVPSGGGAPRRGKIEKLTEAGPRVRYADGSTEDIPLNQVGTRISKAPKERGRLFGRRTQPNPNAPDIPDEDEPDEPPDPDAINPNDEDIRRILDQMSRVMQGEDVEPGRWVNPEPAPDDPPVVPDPPSEPAEDLSGLSDAAKNKVENLKVREIPKGFKLYYDEATDDVLAKDRLGTVWVVDDKGYYGTPLDPRHRREIDEQTMVDVTDHVKPTGNRVVNPEEGESIYDVPPTPEPGKPNKPATPDQIDPDAPDNAPAIKDEELPDALEEGVVDPHLNEMKADGNVTPAPARKVKASELVANGVVVSEANQDKIDKMPELDEGSRVVVHPDTDELFVQDQDGSLRRVDDDGKLSEPYAPPSRDEEGGNDENAPDENAPADEGEGGGEGNAPEGGEGEAEPTPDEPAEEAEAREAKPASPARKAARKRVNQARRSGGGGGGTGGNQQQQNVPPPSTWAMIKELLFRVLTLNLRKRAPVGTPAPAPAPAPEPTPASGVLVTVGAPPDGEGLFDT